MHRVAAATPAKLGQGDRTPRNGRVGFRAFRGLRVSPRSVGRRAAESAESAEPHRRAAEAGDSMDSKIAGTAPPDPRIPTIHAIQSLPHCQARPPAAPSVTLTPGAAAAGRMAVSNLDVARALEERADALALEGANAYRVRAYRKAARSIEGLEEPVARLVA